MKCKEIQNQIDERLRKGGLELPDELRNHIETCPGCTAYLTGLSDLHSHLIVSDPAVRPGELDDITFERIVAAAGGNGRREQAPARGFDLRWLWAPVAAAAIIMLTILLPRFDSETPTTTAINGSSLTSIELINDIAESDSLGGEVLAEMADDMNMDYVAEALIEGSDIDDLLHGLTESEMEALYIKIDDLKG